MFTSGVQVFIRVWGLGFGVDDIWEGQRSDRGGKTISSWDKTGHL